MSDNKTAHYVIKTVEDLFDIPQDKLASCLEDLYTWITFVKKFDDDIKNTFGGRVEKTEFEWICDDKNDLYVKRSNREMN